MMTTNSRPVIAILTGGKGRLPHNPDLYLHAIGVAGAEAVFIGPDEGVKDTVMHYAGFLIPGGRDIDPLLYNEECIAEVDIEEAQRVDFDLALFRAAVGEGRPVLGICYGMQLINVAMGGTLFQDIALQRGRAVNHREGNHGLQVSTNPFFESGGYEVNSSHHQAVKETGGGLSAFASSPDGIIEAFYGPECRFLLGVQWHPERMSNRISNFVFTSFVRACRDQI